MRPGMSLIHKIHGSCPDNGRGQQAPGWQSVVVVGKLARALAGRYAVTSRPQGGGVCGEGGGWVC